MQPRTATATRSRRPNRILIALAAAWMILSLAIGGAVNADTEAQSRAGAAVTSAAQP